jgi:cytosine/uracil/thiamine/allantoin permease
MIQVEETEAMKQNKGGRLWINKDLAPNPPETRHWNSWSFFLFQ